MEIRKLTKKDLTLRVDLLNNPEIARWLNVDETFTLENTEKWFSKIEPDKSRYDVVFLEDSKVVGMGGLVNISEKDQHGELYIYMSVGQQGKGLGKRALSLLIDYSFKAYGLRKLFVYTFAENERANMFYESMNFKKEAHLKLHTHHQGELKDRYIYSLFFEDWQ